MARSVAAQEVSDRGDFQGLLIGERALKRALSDGRDRRCLEGLISEEALVDDVVAVAEEGRLV